jgi:hypothetical protein
MLQWVCETCFGTPGLQGLQGLAKDWQLLCNFRPAVESAPLFYRMTVLGLGIVASRINVLLLWYTGTGTNKIEYLHLQRSVCAHF